MKNLFLSFSLLFLFSCSSKSVEPTKSKEFELVEAISFQPLEPKDSVDQLQGNYKFKVSKDFQFNEENSLKLVCHALLSKSTIPFKDREKLVNEYVSTTKFFKSDKGLGYLKVPILKHQHHPDAWDALNYKLFGYFGYEVTEDNQMYIHSWNKTNFTDRIVISWRGESVFVEDYIEMNYRIDNELYIMTKHNLRHLDSINIGRGTIKHAVTALFQGLLRKYESNNLSELSMKQCEEIGVYIAKNSKLVEISKKENYNLYKMELPSLDISEGAEKYLNDIVDNHQILIQKRERKGWPPGILMDICLLNEFGYPRYYTSVETSNNSHIKIEESPLRYWKLSEKDMPSDEVLINWVKEANTWNMDNLNPYSIQLMEYLDFVPNYH